MLIPKEPEQVIKQRDGSVLGKKTILKSDHFPGCHNKRLVPHIDGAPNYRKVVFLPQSRFLILSILSLLLQALCILLFSHTRPLVSFDCGFLYLFMLSNHAALQWFWKLSLLQSLSPSLPQASSLPVHGVAIPTIDGIRNVLTHIRAHMNGEQIRVLWISLREEPVIFHILFFILINIVGGNAISVLERFL